MADPFLELPGSRRPIPHGSYRVRDLDPHKHMEVTVVLKAPPLPSADQLPDTPMTPEAFAKQYGAAPEDISTVEAVLRSYGLKVDSVGNAGRSLRVSGTAAAMLAAFQASLGIYQSAAQGEFRGREGSVSVPAAVGDRITAVLGLDQRRVAQRSMALRTTARRSRTAAPLSPAELEQHYNFPVGDCAGQKVGIAEFGSPLGNGQMLPPAYFPDDTAAFCKAQKRPLPRINTVPVGLAPLTHQQYEALSPQLRGDVLDATGEVMMDVEIVATLCGKADISVYYAGWGQDGWVQLLDQVLKDRPVVLSVSYGLAEDSPEWAASAITAINDALQALAMIGCTVCVSSGDDGSGCDMTDMRAHVEFPSCSPFVLSVGGTMFEAVGGTDQEVVWHVGTGQRSSGGGATGGGVSTRFARPAWQAVHVATLNPVPFDGRVLPDVSALAGPPYYQLILDGKSAPNGGTSAAAPVWASLIARINGLLPAAKQQRFLTKLLYTAGAGGKTIGTSGCIDITAGDNASSPQPGKGYPAGPGFDAASGWGVPDGKALEAAL